MQMSQLSTENNELHAGEIALLPEDRVVWFSDSGPETATVKWVGRLPGNKNSAVYAGVEFDNPIGSGDGMHQTQRLFQSRRGHASLVPILGLMKVGDEVIDGRNGEHIGVSCSAEHSPPRSSYGRLGTKVDSSEPPNPGQTSAQPPRKDFPTVGDRVEVLRDPARSGTVRWVGHLKTGDSDFVAGVEMDEEDIACYTDGTCLGTRYFSCPPCKALFVHANRCRPSED